jgi:hypothetical protein
MFKGNLLTYLPSISLYQILCRSEIVDKRLVENQYCVGSIPVSSGFGLGVGSDSTQIEAKTPFFKYLT